MVPLEPNKRLSIPCASGVQDIITVLIDQKKRSSAIHNLCKSIARQ